MTLGNWNVPTWLLCNTKKLNTETLKYCTVCRQYWNTQKKAAARLICTPSGSHIFTWSKFHFCTLFLWKYYISKQTFFFYIPRSKLSPLSSQVDLLNSTICRPKMIIRSGATLMTLFVCKFLKSGTESENVIRGTFLVKFITNMH